MFNKMLLYGLMLGSVYFARVYGEQYAVCFYNIIVANV